MHVRCGKEPWGMPVYRYALILSTIVAASTFVTAQSSQSGANDAPVSIYSLVPSPQQPEPSSPAAVRSPAPAAAEGADPAGLVHLSVTVTDDKGKPITNLTKADFVVLEDGQAREIATFVAPRPGELTPMGLGIVMDISAGQDRITSMRTPVEDLLKKLGKDSEF